MRPSRSGWTSPKATARAACRLTTSCKTGSTGIPSPWGSHKFDPKRYPDPAAAIQTLHDKYHLHLMISVWGKFAPGSADNPDANHDRHAGARVSVPRVHLRCSPTTTRLIPTPAPSTGSSCATRSFQRRGCLVAGCLRAGGEHARLTVGQDGGRAGGARPERLSADAHDRRVSGPAGRRAEPARFYPDPLGVCRASSATPPRSGPATSRHVGRAGASSPGRAERLAVGHPVLDHRHRRVLRAIIPAARTTRSTASCIRAGSSTARSARFSAPTARTRPARCGASARRPSRRC